MPDVVAVLLAEVRKLRLELGGMHMQVHTMANGQKVARDYPGKEAALSELETLIHLAGDLAYQEPADWAKVLEPLRKRAATAFAKGKTVTERALPARVD